MPILVFHVCRLVREREFIRARAADRAGSVAWGGMERMHPSSSECPERDCSSVC